MKYENVYEGVDCQQTTHLFCFPSIQDMDKRLQALMGTCEKLPTDNLNNFRWGFCPLFFCFLFPIMYYKNFGVILVLVQMKNGQI